MLNMGIEKEAAKLRQVQPPLSQSVRNMMASVRFYSTEVESPVAKPQGSFFYFLKKVNAVDEETKKEEVSAVEQEMTEAAIV
jgi:hypothetical protein